MSAIGRRHDSETSREVETSSNDQQIYYDAFDWVNKDMPFRDKTEHLMERESRQDFY